MKGNLKGCLGCRSPQMSRRSVKQPVLEAQSVCPSVFQPCGALTQFSVAREQPWGRGEPGCGQLEEGQAWFLHPAFRAFPQPTRAFPAMAESLGPQFSSSAENRSKMSGPVHCGAPSLYPLAPGWAGRAEHLTRTMHYLTAPGFQMKPA